MRILLLAACAVLLAGPAAAQVRSPAPDSALMLEGRALAMSPTEQRAILELSRVRTMSASFQDRALEAAERVVRTGDARYALAIYQLDIARLRNDDALRLRALERLIPNPSTPPAKLLGYLEMRGGIAFRADDFRTASADWTRVVALQPGNTQALINLAQARHRLGDPAGATDLIRRAIAARVGPDPVPEAWYRQWLSIAFNGSLRGEIFPAAHALVTAYPTAENWRIALGLYRQVAAPENGAEIALLRLMRTAGAFSRAAEYQRLAQLLLRADGAAEARQVMEDGIARSLLTRSESPVPEIFRDIDRAAAPRRETLAALPARDPADDAMRSAASLTLAGRRGDAEIALRPVAEGRVSGDNGTYAEIARFWLTWLSRRT